jgi:hypothetical protein
MDKCCPVAEKGRHTQKMLGLDIHIDLWTTDNGPRVSERKFAERA